MREWHPRFFSLYFMLDKWEIHFLKINEFIHQHKKYSEFHLYKNTYVQFEKPICVGMGILKEIQFWTNFVFLNFNIFFFIYNDIFTRDI